MNEGITSIWITPILAVRWTLEKVAKIKRKINTRKNAYLNIKDYEASFKSFLNILALLFLKE